MTARDVWLAPDHEHGPHYNWDGPNPWRPPGSVYLCDCGRYLVRTAWCDWTLVRWWHFRARRRIRESSVA